METLLTAIALFQADPTYVAYPVFGDQDPAYYRDKRVLVVQDRNLTRELIVKCDGLDEGILIHDVISDQYIDAKNKTHKSLGGAIAGTCNR